MGDHLLFTRPSTAVETEHLIGALGGRLSHPQAHQQTGNKGRLPLDAPPIDPLAQHMPAAQDTFDPAEKQCYRPPIPRRPGHQLCVQVQPLGDQAHHIGRAILPRLAGHDLHPTERRWQQARLVRRAPATEDRIVDHPRLPSGRRQRASCTS